MTMRRLISFALWGVLFTSLLAASPGETKKETLRCTLTNTRIEKCCCEQRGKKLYCPLAQKTIDKCCCEPAKAAKEKRSK